MKYTISLIALTAAFPALAENTRELDAHEHGVGLLNIAIDGQTVAIELEAPGADIVGFEYAAESDDDLAAIEDALSTLRSPLDLFVLPAAAGCSVVEVVAELEGDDHDEDEHDEDGYDDHDDDGHDDHDEDEHDDHDEDGHDDHDEHAHDEHEEEAGHTEFHAAYTLTCDAPDALDEITFAYFETFPNALEVEVQYIDATGANAFEVERDAPILDLER